MNTSTQTTATGERADLLAALAKEVDAGSLRVYVESEVSLEQAPQAVARNQAGGARGKTIVKP